jgi:hypothetical protein
MIGGQSPGFHVGRSMTVTPKGIVRLRHNSLIDVADERVADLVDFGRGTIG